MTIEFWVAKMEERPDGGFYRKPPIWHAVAKGASECVCGKDTHTYAREHKPDKPGWEERICPECNRIIRDRENLMAARVPTAGPERATP